MICKVPPSHCISSVSQNYARPMWTSPEVLAPDATHSWMLQLLGAREPSRRWWRGWQIQNKWLTPQTSDVFGGFRWILAPSVPSFRHTHILVVHWPPPGQAMIMIINDYPVTAFIKNLFIENQSIKPWRIGASRPHSRGDITASLPQTWDGNFTTKNHPKKSPQTSHSLTLLNSLEAWAAQSHGFENGFFSHFQMENFIWKLMIKKIGGCPKCSNTNVASHGIFLVNLPKIAWWNRQIRRKNNV